MKRPYRLRKNADFQRVRRLGEAQSNRMLVLIALPNHLPRSRFGFAVSKRIGKAVRRNKIKRQIREAARLCQKDIQAGWDLLFIARAPIKEATYRQIEQAVHDLLRKHNLFVKVENDR
ncbi:MAG: ribonuclease P protein component [Caldilineae bacterium]|nr:MAG: ribonuclease P protein component [Caldilineae bacterium]